MKKSLVLAAVLICIASLVVSAAGKKTIAFIPSTLENEHFVIQVEGAKAEAARLGVTLLVQAGSRHADVEEQVRIIEDMIARKVDAICLVAAHTTGVISGVEKALAAKIPVVMVDNDLDRAMWKEKGNPDIPFIGSKNYDGAKMVAEYALNTLKIAGWKAALLTGVEGNSAAIDRKAGFMDTVKGKVDVVATQTANWEVEQGYTVFQNMLQGHPEIKFLFACNDNMALGAVRAIKEAGRKDIAVIGYDAIPAALDLVKKGQMKATLAQFPAVMGATAVETALKMSNGEKVEMRIYTKLEVITTEKVDQFLKYLGQFKK